MDALHELGLHALKLFFEFMLNRRHAAVLQLLQHAQLVSVGGESLLEHITQPTSIQDGCLQESTPSPVNMQQEDSFTSRWQQ